YGGEPFLGVGENGIDVENHPPERIDPVLDDLSDGELRLAHRWLNQAGLGDWVIEFHGGSITPNRPAGNALNHELTGNMQSSREKLYKSGTQEGGQTGRESQDLGSVDAGRRPVDSAAAGAPRVKPLGNMPWPMV